MDNQLTVPTEVAAHRLTKYFDGPVPTETVAIDSKETTPVSTETVTTASKEEAPLSSKEQELLQDSEQVIGNGLRHFLAVGVALSLINGSRLYRESYPTFDEYCKVRWNLGSDYAYRLIQSADCLAELKGAAESKGYKVLPSNESQVRPLTRLKKPNRQVTAWKKAVKQAKGKDVTAEIVERVVNGMLGKTSRKGSAQSTKKGAERQLKSIGKLVSKELEKSKDLKPNLKKLLKRILELTGMQEKSAK